MAGFPPEKRKVHPQWVTGEMLEASRTKMDDILNRVENFQDEIQHEAEIELARKFNLTDDQAHQLMEEDW